MSLPGTPVSRPISQNVAPEKGGPQARRNLAPLAQQYRTEILDGLKGPLFKLRELKQELHDSGDDPSLWETYKFITDNMRPLFSPGGEFDRLNIGGRKNKSRRHWIKKTFRNK